MYSHMAGNTGVTLTGSMRFNSRDWHVFPNRSSTGSMTASRSFDAAVSCGCHSVESRPWGVMLSCYSGKSMNRSSTT